MQRASIVHLGDLSDRPPPARSFDVLVAFVWPPEWSRLWHDRIRLAARHLDCVFVQFGRRCWLHAPDVSHQLAWSDLWIRRDSISWRLETDGIVVDLLDEHLSQGERRRLESSTGAVSA